MERSPVARAGDRDAGRAAGRREVLFLSGTRADFGKLKPLIAEVERSDDFEYRIFATGMHMLSRYGSTVIEIEKAGFDRIFSYVNQDGSVNSQMDLVLANTIQGLGHYLREFTPDLIVIHGDRVEALAGAIAGALNNVLVAHVEGGEVSGTADELMRHAVSKLAHLHFVANEEAQRRLVQMGERPESIFVIGSPDIDVMLSDDLPTLDAVKRKYKVDFSEYAVVVYHPVTTELASLGASVEALLAALEESGMSFVATYPNNDAGADVILGALEGLEEHPRFRVVPSMRFEHFCTLLKNALVMVGNSSAGIRAAPVYEVPTINVGSRQRGRFDYPSIVNVPDEKESILSALRSLPPSVGPSMHFGTGRSAERFMEYLRRPQLWSVPRQKQFLDMAMDLSLPA